MGVVGQTQEITQANQQQQSAMLTMINQLQAQVAQLQAVAKQHRNWQARASQVRTSLIQY